MSVLQRGSVGRWVFAEVERDLISERTPEGLGQVLGAEARGLKPSPYSVFPHESGRYPTIGGESGTTRSAGAGLTGRPSGGRLPRSSASPP